MTVPPCFSSPARRSVLATIAAAVTITGIAFPPHASAGPATKNPQEPLGSGTEARAGRDRLYFSAGWMWRETGGMGFNSGSRSQHLALPRIFDEASASLPRIGPVSEAADRFYMDGSVRVDDGTAIDGTTSAWSYRNDSQVADGSLHYHATGHRREFSDGRTFGAAEDISFDGSGGAPVIEAGWERELTPDWSLGGRFQWSFLDLDGDHTQSNFSAWQQGSQYSLGFSDTYDLQGVAPPQAPYDGTGLGFGPLIDNRPTSRHASETPTGAGEAHFHNLIHQSFEITLHTVSLGPTVSVRTGPLSVQAGAGLALNIADWKAEQQETLYLSRNGGRAQVHRRWTDRSRDTEVLPGFYLQGGVLWQATPRLFVNGFGRYDWSERLAEQVGPSSFTFDPGGWSAGVLLGFVF